MTKTKWLCLTAQDDVDILHFFVILSRRAARAVSKEQPDSDRPWSSPFSVRLAVQYALAEELSDAVAGVAEQARQNGFVVLAERGRLEFEFLGEA